MFFSELLVFNFGSLFISPSLSVSHRYWHSQNTLHHLYSRCPGHPCRIPRHPRPTWKPRVRGTLAPRSVLHPLTPLPLSLRPSGKNCKDFLRNRLLLSATTVEKDHPKTPVPMYHINNLTNPHTARWLRNCFPQNPNQNLQI